MSARAALFLVLLLAAIGLAACMVEINSPLLHKTKSYPTTQSGAAQ